MWPTTSALALLLASSTASPLAKRANDKEHYANNAGLGAFALQGFWYNEGTGLWGNAWWNSGNALTTLSDWAILRPIEAESLDMANVIHNTFVQAQNANVYTAKTITASGMVQTEDCVDGQGPACGSAAAALQSRAFHNFINHFYDDEGWWALGLIHAYDYTHRQEYLDAAVRIFIDMQGGGGTPCGGGIYWNKDRKYVNAIANELYLSVAASLANRVPGDKAKYQNIAEGHWRWFAGSGMINGDDMINDGLNGDCRNNGAQTWTYNQGVVLGGLTELYKATGNRDYLNRAHTLASASMKKLANGDGILLETDQCEYHSDHCGGDGGQFKGIYTRNLRYLHDSSPSDDIKNFLTRNADSIWDKDRSGGNKLGPAWAGPYYEAGSITHSSALDTLVAAIAVA